MIVPYLPARGIPAMASLRKLSLAKIVFVLAATVIMGWAPAMGQPAKGGRTEPTATAPTLHPAFPKIVPETIGDLKAIQEHVKKLTDKVLRCTVNLKLGGQGSGVIISEDGWVLTAGHV